MKKIFWLIFWLLPFVAFSQDKATFSFTNKPLSETLFFIENTYNVRFSYLDTIIKNKHITIHVTHKSLPKILDKIEKKTNLSFEKISNRYYIVKEQNNTSNNFQLLDEVIIKNYLTKGIDKDRKSNFNIDLTKLDILPGLLEADVLESIQQLPGVVSPNETATGLVVHGGTSDQNRILWDGINIYHNGHLFGMISAFNPNVSKQIKFYNKGTNPRFGEKISSVIDIKTNNKIANKITALYSINGLNSDIVVETPIIKNKLSIQLSARRSYSELINTPTFHSISKKVFQNTKVNNLENDNNLFYFIDYNTKVNYQLNKNNKFYFSGIRINNELNYFTKSKTLNNIYNDKLKIKNDGYSINWNKKWNTSTQQNTTLSFSKYYLNYNFILFNNSNQKSNFDKRNAIYDTNFITELKIKAKNSLNIGYQYSFYDVSYAYINTKKLEILLDYNKNRISTHSIFSNYSTKNYSFLNFDAGFRLNYYTQFKKFRFEPRIILYKKISNKLTAQITGEVKNQTLSQIDETVLSDLSLENKLWHLSNDKTFPITNSKQISTGLLYKNNGWIFDVDHYQKYINGLTALSLGFLNPDGQTFRTGTKKVKGIDLYLKKDLGKIQTWLSYAYTDVRSKFKELNNNDYFTSNTSITHAVSTSITYKLKQFQIALGWKWRTGRPYTKSITNNEITTFEGINTKRLSNYHRLDFSSTYNFNISKNNRLKGKIGFAIRNIYNKKNHLSREYTGFNNINDSISVQDRYSLGLTPNFLIKIYF